MEININLKHFIVAFTVGGILCAWAVWTGCLVAEVNKPLPKLPDPPTLDEILITNKYDQERAVISVMRECRLLGKSPPTTDKKGIPVDPTASKLIDGDGAVYRVLCQRLKIITDE